MLDISGHKVAQVVLMGRELDRAEGELRGFVERLTEEEQVALVAVMWIGRGAFEAEDLAEALSTASNQASTPTADYLIGTPHLSDHLEEGMNILGLDVSEEEDALMGHT
ncbi:DUF3775 domain-containing protein [Primorskyibacter sp. S187A]|uniref:DUF3775 domain-containing protein n=1 Tax=Primorskyibacter sp. S187A TaxID=3415130 RepID=UPI003C7AA8E6